jgi:hypothetical protein
VKNCMLRYAILFLPASVLLGCSADGPTASRPRFFQSPVRSVLLNAPGLVARALRGVKDRGEQDEMLKLENSLPGFGGFFFDDNDNLTVYMKPRGVPAAAIQAALANAYSKRAEPAIRSRMAGAAAARVISGDYSLSELIAVENRIAYPSVRLPGFVGVGVSIFKNRVKVGFTDTAAVLEGVDLIEQMGVPAAVLIPEVWGRPKLLSTVRDMHRPVYDGLQIGLMNRTYLPWDNTVAVWWNSEGSLGFNVKTVGGVQYMLTAGHLVNGFRGVNGGVGDTVLQKGHYDAPYSIYPVGKIVVNPGYGTGAACPVIDSTTMQHFDYCTNADAVLASYFGGISSTMGLGTSTYEGLHGAAGNLNVRGIWSIADVWTPEMVRSGFVGVHKSGSGTGTTTGLLDLPLTNFDALVCYDQWDRNEENTNTNPTPYCQSGWKNMRLSHQVRVNTALATRGDSGGPVFAGDGAPYHALGIVVGGNGDGDTNSGPCTGNACYFWFSKWSEIEARLGQGSLNPSTGQ